MKTQINNKTQTNKINQTINLTINKLKLKQKHIQNRLKKHK